MLTRFWRKAREERGITGLETAIILIAFVVVASVFAYTVLSAGIFSAQKGKEAVNSGLQQASSSMEIIGNVKATGVAATTIHTADAAWTASANVTSTLDASDRKEGADSDQLAIAAGFTTGLIAYRNISATDLSSHYSARLWVKSDTDLAAGVLKLTLDNTNACVSPTENIALPAVTAANGWTQVQVKLSAPSTDNAILCVGLTANSDPGTVTVKVDNVEAPGEVTQLSFVLANALNGNAVDLSTTSDSNSDGLLSDEASPSHVMYATYVDKNQRVNDITWSKTQLGKGDSDNLLEPGEKMQVTVQLKALDPMPVDYTQFTLQLRPQTGSTLSIQRTVPSVVDTSMDLQ